MPERVRLYISPVLNAEGQPDAGARVQIRELDGTTPLAMTLYENETTGTPLGTTTLAADNLGRIITYADTLQDVVAVPEDGSLPWIAQFERTANDRRTLDGYADFYADLYRRSDDESDYECIQRAVDAAWAYVQNTGLRAKVWLSARTYDVHRAIGQRGMSSVAIFGYGVDHTFVVASDDFNGDDAGVTLDDPQHQSLFDASNGAIENVEDYYTDLEWAHMTLVGTNMTAEAVPAYWQAAGNSGSLIDMQNAHNGYAHDLRLVDGPTGITFGNSTPSFEKGFNNPRVERIELVNTPRGLNQHYKQTLGAGHPTPGIGIQIGVALGGYARNLTWRNPNGPAYAVVGSRAFSGSGFDISGYGGEAAVLGGAVGTFNVDFASYYCAWSDFVSFQAGGFVLNGSMTPSIYNGNNSYVAAKGSTFDRIKIVETATHAFLEAPSLVNGGYHMNNSGQDMVVVLNGVFTASAIRVGLRDEDVLPISTRTFVVPNGIRYYLAWSSGTPTAVHWTVRNANGSAPAFPSSGVAAAANGTGLPQVVTITPTLTSDEGAIPSAWLPSSTAAFSVKIGGVERPRTGQRRDQFALLDGEAATLTYNNATVAAAIEAEANKWGYHNVVVTGYTWTWQNTIPWGATPTVPDSDATLASTVIYNPLGLPLIATVETGTFLNLKVRNSAGTETQTAAVTDMIGSAGKLQILIDPGGTFAGEWSISRPTWTVKVAPNASRDAIFQHSGSVTGYQGNIEDCTWTNVLIATQPLGALSLYDGLRCTFDITAIDNANARQAQTVTFTQSGIAGGGTRDCVLRGTLMDNRVTKSTPYHYTDGGALNTGNSIQAHMSTTSGTTVNPNGGTLSRVDATGSRGPAAPGTPLTPPAAPATTVAQANPFSYACMLYLTVAGGSLSAVTLDGTAIGAQSSFRLRVGASYISTYTGTLTVQWVPV